MVDFHFEVKLATFLFMSNCKCLICDPPLSQASCRKWFSFPLCPPSLPISFSFSLFLSSPLFPSLHRGKIRVNTGQDTPVSVSILTECKWGEGGGGGREEGYRKFTVDKGVSLENYENFGGISWISLWHIQTPPNLKLGAGYGWN